MKIIIGSDHGGYELKEALKQTLSEKNIEIKDAGPSDKESVDYPDYAAIVANAVAQGEADAGVLVCGTGLGMSIAANKVNGIRSVVLFDEFTAEMAKAHNNANVVCLGGRTTDIPTAKKLLAIWLDTEFEGDRHQRRLDKIKELENP